MTNKEIIQKADMALADLASGGQMTPEQATKFIEMMQDTPTILHSARVEPMAKAQTEINKIGFNSRILHPAPSGRVALADGERSKPTTERIKLDPQKVQAEVFLDDEVIDNNIEGENIFDTIMRLAAERSALDLEELVVQGDKSSADPYLALIDGVLKQANTHVVDFKSEALSRDVFKQAYKATPQKYIRNPRDWRFYTSHHAALEWMDQVAARQTGLGDRALEGGGATAYGVNVEGISMMQPYDDGAGKSVSDILFTHPKNIIIGIRRDITVEYERNIREQGWTIVITAKIDAKFEEEDATAKVIKVQS
ncbi:phage major capsid family protein [Aneurinibacillus migulanus]|uniref:Phage major capsid protein, HK97 family n=1 Tax=Aneurinibacillus migulanus TaxID=47500 RepID=A0A0D1YNR9_ANEMI|nr:phage major capsid protein [Aneurinibacillus migulanus]KIV60287.1 phage portal protein [Aneurinibacillus migulanus]KON90514.1 phage portal protein [Aneurinibacillus migulanus]MED0894903.1 phage major capsid protein [Aneurinibacillus migulanus]MED1614454.1 phage major capsid protein [Aneurinibacillus migulanus]SDJ77238.1 phage major capsid protein, HK97 family [Aneurinibacillus migulanus]